MSLLCPNKRRAVTTATFALALALPSARASAALAGPAASSTEAVAKVRVCVDSASPAAAFNRRIAKEAAAIDHWSLSIDASQWSPPDDDEGVTPKKFRAMASKDCDLVMGYPVVTGFTVPAGLHTSEPYLRTGYDLVAHGAAPDWASLPQGAEVAAAYNTPAALIVAQRKGVTPIIYDTDPEALAAVRSGKTPLGLVWDLTLKESKGGATGLGVKPLSLPQAHWTLAALYADRAAKVGAAFDHALDQLRKEGRIKVAAAKAQPAATPAASTTAAAAPAVAAKKTPKLPPAPQLYAAAQGTRGKKLYLAHCAICHAKDLQGHIGPALMGQGFAGPGDGFTVGAIFTYLSTEMPASAPGSLKHDEYAAIMSYILKKNGYPAGAKKLTYDSALSSSAPLISRVRDVGSKKAKASN